MSTGPVPSYGSYMAVKCLVTPPLALSPNLFFGTFLVTSTLVPEILVQPEQLSFEIYVSSCISFSSSGGLSEAAIAGIVVGVLVALLLVAAVAFFAFRHHQNKKEKQDPCLQSAKENRAFN